MATSQEGFRWRNDDGSETTATWKAAQDTNTALAVGTATRLRVVLDATGNPPPTPYTLYYKKTTDSTWLPVPVGPTTTGALAKYRTFNGTTDLSSWSLGNLSGVSSEPATMVAVVRLRTAGADAELIHAPDYDPMDWFYAGGNINYFDGGFGVGGPSWTAGSAATDWRLWAFRSRPTLVALWSQSRYNGTSWPTPTHTTATGTATRSFPTSGVITIGGTPPMNVDIVCIARFNTNLSDAQIDNMTNGVSAIQGTSNLTNLWMLGQATPADLVGTSSLNSLTGTTLSSGDSPFPTGGSGGASGPVYIKTSSNITAGGEPTTAQLTPPAGGSSGGLSDDFSGSSVDSPPWTVYNRVGDLANSEVNGVIPANVRVSSGTLKIDSKFEDVVIGDSETAPATYHYTSGQIGQSTSPFMYGDVQVRAKIAGGTGTWPCIWMLGYQWQATQPYTANTPGHNWPVDGWCEIDIAEFMYGARDEVNCSLHYQTAGAPYGAALPFNATTRFMVYRLLWTATSLTWQVDAEDGVGWRTLRTVVGAAGTAVPNVPMYLIIHTAIGGGGGTPNSSTFPVTMEVDYARVITDSGKTTTSTIGNTTQMGSSAPANPDFYCEALVGPSYRYTASAGDVVTEAAVYGDSTGDCQIGVYVYSGGVPTTRVGTINVAVGSAAQWHVAAGSIPLTAGVTYVVAIDYYLTASWNIRYGTTTAGDTSIDQTGSPTPSLQSTWTQNSTSGAAASYYATVTNNNFTTGRMWDDENGIDSVDI